MIPFDWRFPYPSQRMPILAQNVVATSQPLAAQAGLSILQKGGNAVDAALATAITLTLVEPTGNGLGSDAFALIWDGQKLHGLNASGRAPRAWGPERFKGQAAMPPIGWDSVTVPGAVSGWVACSQRFGRLPFAELFQPVIHYARDGFLVSPIIAQLWAKATHLFEQPGFAEHFLPNGRPPQAGELFKAPYMADTYQKIAETNGEAFYRGELAARMAAHARQHGGALTEEDLAAHQVDWVEPIAIDYHGYTLHEIPPNGQGMAALMALGILENFDLGQYPVDSADSLHLQIEAMKLAFADVYRYVADIAAMDVQAAELLDRSYLKRRAGEINMQRASNPLHGTPRAEGTVYLTAADQDGMMVSFIQSNYRGFGSGVVVPGTGISLQNRGSGFSLQEGHPNRVAGGKRPFHTIIPGFVTKNGQPVMSFGVMGANMQPQGHLQMMVRLVDYHQNPQAASDAPRWRINEEKQLMIEPGFAPEVLAELQRRGHALILAERGNTDFGRAQFALRLEQGYLAASESRIDGQAVGY
jgi:gamma-glutamyltranspeptidase / glutathione hydrolase